MYIKSHTHCTHYVVMWKITLYTNYYRKYTKSLAQAIHDSSNSFYNFKSNSKITARTDKEAINTVLQGCY